MSFVAWIFLFGSVAVIGPVLAHWLAKPKYKRIPFTMLQFLSQGKVQTQNRSKLRDFLILLLRCTIIVLIAMLFARPQWPTQVTVDDMNRIYYVGLDNSISMEYKDADQTYFDEMIDSALEYIKSAEINGSFNICALASGDWYKQVSREQALMHVKRLKICHTSAQAEDFLSEIRNAAGKAGEDSEISAMVISDFTPKTLKQFVNYNHQISLANFEYKIIASDEVINNAAILDAVADKFSDGKLNISVNIVNNSPISQKRTLTAKVIDGRKSSVDIVVSPDQQISQDIELDINAGDIEMLLPIELSLSAGDGLDVDDKHYMVVSLPKHRTVNILLLGKSKKEMFLLKTIIETISLTAVNETIKLKECLFNNFDNSDIAWSNVVICTSVSNELTKAAKPLRNFVSDGGKVIFFMSAKMNSNISGQLWKQGVFAALPGKYIGRKAHIQKGPSAAKLTSSEQYDSIVQSLHNYEMQNIAFKGFYECTPIKDGVCNWQFENGYGLVYSRSLGKGTAILVNTSADDSMASLMKSKASIAFGRYLLGSGKDINTHSFTCDEQVRLPANKMEINYAKAGKSVWVETCDGQKNRASVVDPFIVPITTGGSGWMKTLSKPTRYAGVNLNDGETDMTKPDEDMVANLMGQIFDPQGEHASVAAVTYLDYSYKQLWKIFAWIIIVLILAEAVLVNRMKR